MILNAVDLTHLDAELDPKDYPDRKGILGPLTPDVLLTEEMMEFGIMDESELTQENYLKARRQYVAGHLTSFGEVIKLAKQLTAEERRDIPPDDWYEVVDWDEWVEWQEDKERDG